MIINATNVGSGVKRQWDIPSKDDAIRYSVATWGERWDNIERELVKGGLPTLFRPLTGTVDNTGYHH